MWADKSIFRKIFVTSVYDSYINIPILTKSENWNYNAMTFISGLKEINMLNYDNSFFKKEEKISDSEYKITYNPIGIKKVSTSNPNNDIFSNSYTISNAYYTRFQIKMEYSDRGGEVSFDMYENGKFKDTINIRAEIVGDGHYLSWIGMISRVRVDHADFKSYTYTFKNLRTSGTVKSSVIMVMVDSYAPEYYGDSRMMGTNIIFGENLKLIKTK